MAGLATRIKVAELAAGQISAPNRAIVTAHPEWYYFGALGPAIGDLVPSDLPEAFGDPGRTPYWSVWREILKIAVGDPSTGLPGVAPVLRTFQKLLDQISALAAAEDLGDLEDFANSGAVDELDDASAALGIILQEFSDPLKLLTIGTLMGTGPAINNTSNLVPPALWTGRDWLHWKSPGLFAGELLKAASNSGDDRFLAYALGWQASIASILSSSGFINSSVGSVYRTHWWRHRWISNFIDTWVWGYYESGATMAGDIPNPSYGQWPGLCDAGLHKLIDIAGGTDFEAIAVAMAHDEPMPELLPVEFTDMWLDAFANAYGSVTPPLFTTKGLQRAYDALGVVLWFQTSGDVIGCNPLPGNPPTDCYGKPDWTDPTETNPATGEPFQPAKPTPEQDMDEGKIVSGVILALLGLAALFFGGGAAGVAGLAGGIKLVVDGVKQIDWEELRCDIYWIKVYLHNGLTALHNLTVLGGVQHPYPRDLEVDELVLKFGDSELPYDSGATTCKSKGIEGLRQPWGGAISTWTSYPTEAWEQPFTDVWAWPDLWPSAIVDDAAANPTSHDIRTAPAPWPGGINGSIGPAVQNAVLLIDEPGDDLPNWNLDGDRGRGWLTWKLTSPYTSPVNPAPEP